MTALVGKYFIGVHDGCMRSGIVEAAIDPRHYLVRFDDVIGFTHGSEWPASLAVVPISEMTQGDMSDTPIQDRNDYECERQNRDYGHCMHGDTLRVIGTGQDGGAAARQSSENCSPHWHS